MEQNNRPHSVNLETTHYEKFQKLKFNREIDYKHVEEIKKSMEKDGFLPFPIIVNEKYEVIDGQHRLEAGKQLGIPVLYTMQPGLTIDHTMLLNGEHEDWSEAERIKSFADQGYQAYVHLMEVKAKYPLLNTAEIVWTQNVNINGTELKKSIKNRTFVFHIPNEKEEALLKWIDSIKPYLDSSEMNRRNTIQALIRLSQLGLINESRMRNAIIKCYGLDFMNGKKTDAVLQALQKAYNYCRKANEREYFVDKYYARKGNKNGTDK